MENKANTQEMVEVEELELEAEEEKGNLDNQHSGIIVRNGSKELGRINGFLENESTTTIYYEDNQEVVINNDILSDLEVSKGDGLTLKIKDGEYSEIVKEVKEEGSLFETESGGDFFFFLIVAISLGFSLITMIIIANTGD